MANRKNRICTTSVPHPIYEWVQEEIISKGESLNYSAYVLNLIVEDKQKRESRKTATV